MTDGLKNKYREAVIDILATNERVERVVLFGSRAMETFTVTSDVDIALIGDKLTLSDQAELVAAIDEVSMPQKVDILLYRSIKSEKLLAHIKRYGVEWWRRHGVMRSEWLETNLGSLANLKNGKGLKTTEYKDNGTYPVWGANGPIARTDHLLNSFAVIVIGRVGAYCGSVHQVKEPNWVTDNAIVATPKEGNDFQFLYYLLKFIKPEQTSVGSAQPLVTQSGLNTIACTVPPTEKEQRAIAHILGSLDDKIELNRQMNRTLEKMAQAIFKSWFIDFDPVRAKAEDRDPGLPKNIADLFPDSFEDSELGEIPKGWGVSVLGDIAENPRRSVKPDTVPPATPYIGLQDMPRRCIALDKWGSADEVGSQKSQFAKGEILFGKLRPYFHKVGIAPVDGVCSTDILVVVPRTAHWGSYTLFLVSSKTFIDYTDAHSAGTRMPRTNWKDMSQFSLISPPLGLLEVFESVVSTHTKKIIENIFESRKLSSLRDTLLPKLISGELTISDAEKILEGVE